MRCWGSPVAPAHVRNAHRRATLPRAAAARCTLQESYNGRNARGFTEGVCSAGRPSALGRMQCSITARPANRLTYAAGTRFACPALLCECTC